MLALLLVGALIEPQGRAAAPPAEAGAVSARSAAPVEFRVVVAAPVYRPDGGVSAETATLSNTAPSLVYVYGRRSLCDTSTTGSAEPADAGFGWRLASHTVSQSASETVVSIDWQRKWDRGQKLANGPSGTVQLTLHPGDRIPLDHIPNMAATDACRAVGMGLEVRLARAAPAAPAGAGSVILPLGAAEGGGRVLDADLWLVHTQPSGTEQVQHQTVRLPTSGGTFSFSPMKFTTAQGEVGVELTGSIQRFRSPSGEFLLVSMARVITGGTAPSGGLGGTTGGTLIALPGPGEVLSFEMPGAERPVLRGGAAGAAAMSARVGGGGGAGGGGGNRTAGPGPAGSMARTASGGAMGAAVAQASRLLDGQSFSIRVRLTPVPGM
jgi:hypothetical protein